MIVIPEGPRSHRHRLMYASGLTTSEISAHTPAILRQINPQLEGTGEIKLESVDRAGGHWTTRSEGADAFIARTSGIYLRADPGDTAVLDGNAGAERAALTQRRLEEWKSFANS